MGFLDALGDVLTRNAPAIISGVGAVFQDRERRKALEAQASIVRAQAAAAPVTTSPISPVAMRFAPSGGSLSLPFPTTPTIFGPSLPEVPALSAPVFLPGGAPVRQAGALTDMLTGRGLLGLGAGASISQPFRATATSVVPQVHAVENPQTGRLTWFRPAGRPILWSSDLSACKRVNKIARRASRSRGRR